MGKVLINLFDIHNQAAVLSIDHFRPEKVIYIVDCDVRDIYEEVSGYEKAHFKDIKFEEKFIRNEQEAYDIHSVFENLDNGEILVNITGGKRIISLLMLGEALKHNIEKIFYMDIEKKAVYDFGNLNLTRHEIIQKDISFNSMFKLTGTKIIEESTKLSSYQEVRLITDKIYENFAVWKNNKRKLYDHNIFSHDFYNKNIVYVNLENLNENEIKLLNTGLKYLASINGIKYHKNEKTIKVIFLKDYLRPFIFKSGTWLEVLTELQVKKIMDVDEVKSGVVFTWEEADKTIKNEVDVVAVKDSVFTCISCKDSEKYDENSLNELEVYSKRLGGNTVKKILVATNPPFKKTVEERAKALDINLIVLGDDLNKFKKQLENVILS